MDRTLLDDDALQRSAVVANCAMNRERQLVGPNSYARELGFDPVDRLVGLRSASAAWLDLCCGSGRALVQAGLRLVRDGHDDRISVVGVDLVDHFEATPAPPPVQLVSAPILSWTPQRRFDLITCVHGLHYVGDKLGALIRVASWLTEGGMLVADLDLTSVRLPDGRPAGRRLVGLLRRAGFDYDARRHRISRAGPLEFSLPYIYLGADDRAGPNYTGQPAVNSYYLASG